MAPDHRHPASRSMRAVNAGYRSSPRRRPRRRGERHPRDRSAGVAKIAGPPSNCAALQLSDEQRDAVCPGGVSTGSIERARRRSRDFERRPRHDIFRARERLRAALRTVGRTHDVESGPSGAHKRLMLTSPRRTVASIPARSERAPDQERRCALDCLGSSGKPSLAGGAGRDDIAERRNATGRDARWRCGGAFIETYHSDTAGADDSGRGPPRKAPPAPAVTLPRRKEALTACPDIVARCGSQDHRAALTIDKKRSALSRSSDLV